MHGYAGISIDGKRVKARKALEERKGRERKGEGFARHFRPTVPTPRSRSIHQSWSGLCPVLAAERTRHGDGETRQLCAIGGCSDSVTDYVNTESSIVPSSDGLSLARARRRATREPSRARENSSNFLFHCHGPVLAGLGDLEQRR